MSLGLGRMIPRRQRRQAQESRKRRKFSTLRIAQRFLALFRFFWPVCCAPDEPPSLDFLAIISSSTFSFHWATSRRRFSRGLLFLVRVSAFAAT
jgi:hypothetical protein